MSAYDEEIQRFRHDLRAAIQHDDDEARQFLHQLQVQTETVLGISSPRLDFDATTAREIIEEFMATSFPETWRQNSKLRAQIEEYYFSHDRYNWGEETAGLLAMVLRNVEKTAVKRIPGADAGVLPRPLVGLLNTGQVNAVSMHVPGGSRSHLVLFERGMAQFAGKFSAAFSYALPIKSEGNGSHQFNLNADAVRERIINNPGVLDRFASAVVSYAVNGEFSAGEQFLPPNYNFLSHRLEKSLECFVLGHEYAHVLLGHLRSAHTHKGVLPTAETETLAYSWKQEFDADQVGMFLSINAGIDYNKSDIVHGFWGIGLFFDSLEIMDRAVALLQTGDDNARQLGSHPPCDSRKQHLRELLPQMCDTETASEVRAALVVAEAQGQIIRVLWDLTRPILLDLRRRGVPAARTWRTIPKEARG